MASTSKVKNLTKLTPQDRKKEIKRRIAQSEEEIKEMGQDSETKAAKAVIELHNKWEKEEEEEKNKKLETLQDKRFRPKIFSYKEQLAIFLADMVEEENLPRDWKWVIDILPQGIGIKVSRVYDGKSFIRSRRFKITGDVKYDFHACVLFSQWVGDVVLREVEQKDKLILPKHLKDYERN